MEKIPSLHETWSHLSRVNSALFQLKNKNGKGNNNRKSLWESLSGKTIRGYRDLLRQCLASSRHMFVW